MSRPGNTHPTKLADAVMLATLHDAAFGPGERWSAETFTLQLGQPGVHGLLDRRGGFLLVQRALDQADILTLAVIPESRRRGIANALLNGMIARLRNTGVAQLYLEVGEDNLPARQLYRLAGFENVGRRPRYYSTGQAALIMRMCLSRSEQSCKSAIIGVD